jgi:hypothetical protein
MPPKGWTKKNKMENKSKTTEKKSKITVVRETSVIQPPEVSKKVKDELGEQTRSISDDQFKSKVLVVWRDGKGRQRTTQYIMTNDFELRESLTEQFTANGSKKSFLHLNLDGTVLEKI